MMAANFLARGQRAALLAIAVLIPAVALAQASVQYDHQAKVNEEIMETLYFRTIECMEGMTKASLRQGVRDRKALMTTNMHACGRPLYQHLVVTMGWESKDAAGLLLATSDRSITSVTK
jgi:hypothetical protein